MVEMVTKTLNCQSQFCIGKNLSLCLSKHMATMRKDFSMAEMILKDLFHPLVTINAVEEFRAII